MDEFLFMMQHSNVRHDQQLTHGIDFLMLERLIQKQENTQPVSENSLKVL